MNLFHHQQQGHGSNLCLPPQPIPMLSWKWSTALAAGCTVVLKPAEQTPLTALAMAALSLEVGFPPGVINVVAGPGETCGSALTHHMDVDKVAFTGSTAVGRLIQVACAQSNLKRCTLELGGKSPIVVFEDVEDLEEAVKICYDSVFENAGQCCCAATRTFVQAGIYDKFVVRARELAVARRLGGPWEEATEQGPQVDRRSLEKVLEMVESGKAEGAKLECGGERLGDKGYFVKPTVFSGVQDDMRIAKEEIFGPVQSIFKFDTMDELIERVNKTDYGLAAGVLTSSLDKALVFSQVGERAGESVREREQEREQEPLLLPRQCRQAQCGSTATWPTCPRLPSGGSSSRATAGSWVPWERWPTWRARLSLSPILRRTPRSSGVVDLARMKRTQYWIFQHVLLRSLFCDTL